MFQVQIAGVQHNTGPSIILPLDVGSGRRSIVVKDNFDVAGVTTTCGSAALGGCAKAEVNSSAVDRLVGQGWHIVGRANMHELAFGMTGVNDYYGTPVNPRWPKLIPGGSSSGSATAVAAAQCDASLGTDTGGSVRLPAACCGIYGLKPTFGRIDRSGVWPKNSSLDCIGIFSRDLDVLAQAFYALDTTFIEPPFAGQPKLGFVEECLESGLGQPLFDVLARSAADTRLVPFPGLPAAFDAGMSIINAEMAESFGYLIADGAPLGGDVRERLSAACRTTVGEVEAASHIRRAATEEVDKLLSTVDVLVTPSSPIAPPALADLGGTLDIAQLTKYLRPFNLTGHPAISIPASVGTPFPVGLQLVGRRGDDAALLSVARWLVANVPELGFRGRVAG